MNIKQKIKLPTLAIMIILYIALLFAFMDLGFSKFALNMQDETKLQFYEYRIDPSDIILDYTGDEITVTINTEKTGLTIQYKLGDSNEWVDYNGPFSPGDNEKLEARLVAKDFEGPVTDKKIAVAKIGDTYYSKLTNVIAACPENAGNSQTKIETLANVKESVVIPEGKNIILDLCGNTVTSDKEETINVNGKFNLIDSKGKRKNRVYFKYCN